MLNHIDGIPFRLGDNLIDLVGSMLHQCPHGNPAAAIICREERPAQGASLFAVSIDQSLCLFFLARLAKRGQLLLVFFLC